MPPRDPVKISRLTLENRSDRKRRLSVTAYAEWVLGVARGGSAPFVVTEIDPATGAMFARNAWNGEFAGRVAFADLGGRQTSCTGDRLEFLGRNAGLDHPASLERGRELSGKTGAGLDPCAALQTTVELEPGERTEVVFMLGQEESRDNARSLVERYRTMDLRRGSPRGLRRAGTGCWVLFRSRLPSPRWTSSSTAGFSIRRSPAGCGPAPRSTSLEGRTDSATSSRTSWPWR